MSWTDLAKVTQPQCVTADICIIGAGAAGIYLATQLTRSGKTVIVIEAGSEACREARDIGFDVEFSGKKYPGATSGRFFGMGGTTSHWGGALVPHAYNDLRSHGAFVEDWTHIVQVVADTATDVLGQLGYQHGSDFERYANTKLGSISQSLAGNGIAAQSALYLPFRKKNFVSQLAIGVPKKNKPRIFFNAVAKEWKMGGSHGQNANIKALKAISSNGNELVITATKFVITAGAIESPRMLLEINDSGSGKVLRSSAAGCYLADHLSLPIADVKVDDLSQVARIFGPRFHGAWMRSFRFLLMDSPGSVPRAFTHFIFSNQSPGFVFAKEILSAMQRRAAPRLSVSDAMSGFVDILRLAYYRYGKSRLFIPRETPVNLQMDIEQEPVKENRVTLTDKIDMYGRRIPCINWQISEYDIESIRSTAKLFLRRWSGIKNDLPTLRPRVINDDGCKPYDAYHPVGTCRMGNDLEAVVDHDLKVWGVDNLWLVSTGVLPSAGTANPTFTMLCLAHHLSSQFITTK